MGSEHRLLYQSLPTEAYCSKGWGLQLYTFNPFSASIISLISPHLFSIVPHPLYLRLQISGSLALRGFEVLWGYHSLLYPSPSHSTLYMLCDIHVVPYGIQFYLFPIHTSRRKDSRTFATHANIPRVHVSHILCLGVKHYSGTFTFAVVVFLYNNLMAVFCLFLCFALPLVMFYEIGFCYPAHTVHLQYSCLGVMSVYIMSK